MHPSKELHNWEDVWNVFKKSMAYKRCLAKNLLPTFWRWLKGRYPHGVKFNTRKNGKI